MNVENGSVRHINILRNLWLLLHLWCIKEWRNQHFQIKKSTQMLGAFKQCDTSGTERKLRHVTADYIRTFGENALKSSCLPPWLTFIPAEVCSSISARGARGFKKALLQAAERKWKPGRPADQDWSGGALKPKSPRWISLLAQHTKTTLSHSDIPGGFFASCQASSVFGS